jgi:hypothetical protein
MKPLASFALLVLLAASCSEKETDPPGNETKTQLITASAWKYDNGGVDANKDGTIDFSITSQLQTCQTDNTLTLTGNGTGTVSEGATKCDPSAPQNVPITWNFSSNETNVNLNGGGIAGLSGQFKLITLNTTTLTLSKDTTLAPFGAIALVLQLKH